MTGLVAGITPNWYRNEPPKDEVYGQWMFGLNQTYVALIENSGFIPFCFLPMADEDSTLRAVESVDLVVLTGGGDPDPDLYDCEVNGSRTLRRERPLWDMSVYRAARELGKPVVGICLGIQLIAVAEGSPLIQDISAQIDGALDHDGSAVSPSHHDVELIEGTILHGILGHDRHVSSFHHQAVRDLPDGFVAAGYSSDGILEAMESADGRVLAVQWHPERDSTGPDIFGAVLKRMSEGNQGCST